MTPLVSASWLPTAVMLETATSVQGIVHDRDSGQPVDADAVMLVVAAPGVDPRATEVELGGRSRSPRMPRPWTSRW